jgi:uncharacterized membrane protein YphA (DoxX/SURF4 family)
MTAVTVRPGLLIFGRITIALVWMYEGLLAKVLGGRTDEQGIADSVPMLSDQGAEIALRLLGGYEVVLGLWVLTGMLRRWAAVVQSLTLVAVNATGLIFAPEHIADPLDLVVKNAALLALIMIVGAARSPSSSDHGRIA